MTLRGKLLLAQAPLALALAIVGIVGSVNVSSLGRHSEAILQDNFRSVLAAQRMKDGIARLEDVPVLALLGEPTEELFSRATTERQAFERELKVQEGNLTEIGEKEATERLRRAWVAYQSSFDRLRPTIGTDAARDLFLRELESASREVRVAADGVLTINQDVMVRKSELARQVAKRTNLVTTTVGMAALLIGALVSALLTSRILEPLGMLTRTVQRIGEGDFDARVDVSTRDELAQLANSVNSMATRLGEYRHSSLGELLLAQQASQAAIDSLPDPVVVFDLDGGILNVNRAAETILGLGLKPLAEIYPAARDLLERVRGHVLGGKGAYVPRGFDEAVPVPSDEGDRYLLPRGTPVYSESGGVTGATVALQDVTRARLVDELRNDLVATVAHEFRTPLTSLWMAIHMCLEGAAGSLSDKQSDLLYAARDDCQRLQSMVDELLDLARIRGGKIELERRATAPAVLVDTALSAYRKAADEHHIVLQTAVLPGTHDVKVDRERVQLVLSNLLSNALRHTPAGGSVEIRVQPGEDHVRFEVVDNGEGIPLEYRPAVFDKFMRVPGRPGGSAGLGLSICKEIVEAHGGSIGVGETPGGGATFWFTLPYAVPEATTA